VLRQVQRRMVDHRTRKERCDVRVWLLVESMVTCPRHEVIGIPMVFITGPRYEGSDDLSSLKAVVRLTLSME
jgi:hypothetical protein